MIITELQNNVIGSEAKQSSPNRPEVAYRNMRFQGKYAVIGENDNAPVYLFLGNGQLLAIDNWRIAATNAEVQASLTRSGNDCELYASDWIALTVPVSGDHQPVLTKIDSDGEKLQGTMSDGIFTVQVPPGKYRMTLAEKNKKVVCYSEYGAVGGGVADDFDAIIKASDAANKL